MIKKRVFVTIFFTCLSLFLLQDFWLIKKPIDVGFNFEGKNINSVELRLSKENSSDFEEYENKTIKLNNANKKYLKFSFEKPHYPKRLQIVINLEVLI